MRVEAVRGAMAVDGLGTTVMHEHVFTHSGCDAELRARVAVGRTRRRWSTGGCTGDIVRVDDAGRVHIVDRIKDIIIMVARTFPASMSNPRRLPHPASRKPR